MRRIRIIKKFSNIDSSEVYGGSDNEGHIIINIEKIYNEYGEKDFAKMFSKIYTHELLHTLISQNCPAKSWSQLGEERVVMMMNGEDLLELGPYEKYYEGKRHGKKSTKNIRRLVKD